MREQAARGENENGLLWTQRNTQFRAPGMTSWFLMTDVTAVHFTCPEKFKPYKAKCCILGSLEPLSLQLLQELFRKAMSQASKTNKAPTLVVDDFGQIASSRRIIPRAEISVNSMASRAPFERNFLETRFGSFI